METPTKPRALVVYYTFSQQTERVADVIGETLGRRGFEVTRAKIEFTDTRWAKRFEQVPMRWPLLKIVGMLPAQIRQATGEIHVPPEAQSGDYDLVVVGSPTWWFRVSVPVRSYLKSACRPDSARRQGLRWVLHLTPLLEAQRRGESRSLGEHAGGRWVEQTHFVAAGNQVQSMLAWLGYMSGFTYLDRLLHLPPTNLQAGFETQAQTFAETIADAALPRDPSTIRGS